jgi:hypothetical protein
MGLIDALMQKLRANLPWSARQGLASSPGAVQLSTRLASALGIFALCKDYLFAL